MPSFNVNVKWGRETYKDIECCTDEDPPLFKAQIFALTGVHPSHQKLMVKGKTLGDDSWTNFPISQGATLLLMGTKMEDMVSAPAEKTKFVEDMNDSEIAKAMELPVGLVNLGNTCYLNATVQCLKTVPPLAEALRKYSSGGGSDYSSSITSAMRDLYSTMDKKLSLPPLLLLQAVHTAFPRFAERGEGGVWAQQDASECWTEIVRMLQSKLPSDRHLKYNSIIDQYFGLKLSIEWKNNEAPEEAPYTTTENSLSLSCFIATETRYIQAGLINKLEETITKNSVTLNRDAEYTKKARIDRLPAYLTIQMVRFFYKTQGVNAKILKDVKFPLVFDAFELCTGRLQEKLLPLRKKFKEQSDAEAEGKGLVAKNDSKKSKDKEENDVKTTPVPYWFHDDVGSNNSGFYELQAVLTHKGRSSSSGHYVSWIKHKDGVWLKCDDDMVTAVSEEEILKLSGGGDWHCAYVLLYGPKVLHVPEGEIIEPVLCEASETEKETLTSSTE